MSGWWKRMFEEQQGKPSHTILQSVVGTVVGSVAVITCIVRASVPAGFAELLFAYMGIVIIGRGWSKYVEVKHARSANDVSADLLEANSGSERSPSARS